MASISSYSKEAVNVYGSSNKYRHKSYNHNNITIINSSVSVSKQYTPSNSPIQIRLPLQQSPKRKDPHHPPRPHPHKPQPPKPSWRKKSNTSRSTTTSDVLWLMDSLRLPISHDIYASLIKECTDTRDAVRAAELHAHINKSGLQPALSLLNQLLLMYASCGRIYAARQLFDEMNPKDLNSWATMIAGHVDDGDCEEAVNLFVQMRQHHHHNNNNNMMLECIIIVCVLKACVRTMNVGLGKQVHGWLLKVGHGTDLFLCSSLINFYGKFGCLDAANFVFDQTLRRDTVIWTATIVNNCREEHFDEALNGFKEMGRAGIKKNSFTFSSVLMACGRIKDDGCCGRQVHANAIKLGVESGKFVRCGLVDMYGKCGLLRDARRVFEMVSDKGNTACWNAMLTGYIHHGCCIEAIKFLYRMKAAGLQPKESLIREVRIACGSKTFENNE